MHLRILMHINLVEFCVFSVTSLIRFPCRPLSPPSTAFPPCSQLRVLLCTLRGDAAFPALAPDAFPLRELSQCPLSSRPILLALAAIHSPGYFTSPGFQVRFFAYTQDAVRSRTSYHCARKRDCFIGGL